MRQAKKTKRNGKGLQRSKKVEAVKTLKTAKVVDASSSTLFNGVSSGTHIPPAK